MHMTHLRMRVQKGCPAAQEGSWLGASASTERGARTAPDGVGRARKLIEREDLVAAAPSHVGTRAGVRRGVPRCTRIVALSDSLSWRVREANRSRDSEVVLRHARELRVEILKGGHAMNFSRTLLAIAAAVLGTFALVGAASAAAPVTTTIMLPGTGDAGSNGYCSFPVTVVYTSAQQLRPGPNGLVTGHATATVRNDQTGKTLSYNVSGPGKVTNNADGSFSVVAGGPNLLWTTVANSYPGVPQLAYSTGRVQFTVASSGETTSYGLNGQRTDVCAALA